MPFKICKMIELESGHLLSKNLDTCQFPHGHTRKVELVFSADTLDEVDMVFDFKAVKEMMGAFLDQFDHSISMNSDDPMFPLFKKAYGERVIAFPSQDPTSENMARLIFTHTKKALKAYIAKGKNAAHPIRDCVKLAYVKVWETSTSWAEYCE